VTKLSQLIGLCGLSAFLALALGCASERSFPIEPQRVVRLAADVRSEPPALSTRQWLEVASRDLDPLLPRLDKRPLTTESMRAADGSAIDVYEHFGVNRDRLHMLLWNFEGILHTAQVAQHERLVAPPAWPDFHDVWIPVAEGVELSGRLGLAQEAGGTRTSDCIVVLPGILGDKSITRTRDICEALRAAGHHVLALDLRGLGQTKLRHPEIYSTFGTLEIGDLLAVAEWLESKPYVRHTGLVGFCWGANQALLVSWEDGRADDDPDVGDALRTQLRPRKNQRHYEAGIIAYSPVARYEEIIDRTAEATPIWVDPVLNALQKRINEHAQERGYESPGGYLLALLRREVALGGLPGEQLERDGLRYLRLLPYRDQPVGKKLEQARMPVLIVHGVNDPLARAQAVADLLAQTRNPNVAGLMLAGGGHDGFAPYAKDHFYSLMLNFFDTSYGAAAALERDERLRKDQRERLAQGESGPLGTR